MRQLTSACLLVVWLSGCGGDASEPASADQASKDYVKTKSGLKYRVLKPRKGKQPKRGDTVHVHYRGRLTSGKEFDSSYKRGKPFKFVLGRGQVIAGWDEGVALLHVGEKAEFVIPPDLGYGKNGYPPVIPGNATLIFDVELVDID